MREAVASSGRLRTVLIALAIALVGAGVMLAYTAPEPDERAPVGPAATLREVDTLRIEATAIPARVRVSGMLEARRSVQIFGETRGPVIAVGAEELDTVERGQLLVAIDPLLAEVALERAEAAVTRSRSELALARSNLERRSSLAERGVASDADLDDAVSAESVARAALREARADLKLARDDLQKKRIVAPFAGVLRSFPIEVGEYIGEGEQLGELLDLETARATIGLTDRELVAVRAGQPVHATAEAYPHETFTGEILRVGSAMDPATRKFPIEVELPNLERRLLPGMIVEIVFELGAPRATRTLPREATLDEFGLRFVYVIGAEGNGAAIARRRRVVVRSLPFRPAEFEILSGLEEGEEIAVSGIRELRDGEPVHPRSARP